MGFARCKLPLVPPRNTVSLGAPERLRGAHTPCPSHTYLDSKERLALIEAAQGCREGVEGAAFLRHLVCSPRHHTPSLKLRGRGHWMVEPQSHAQLLRSTASSQQSESAPSPRPVCDFSPPLKPIRSTRSIPAGLCPACHAHGARNSHVTRLDEILTPLRRGLVL